MSRFNLLGHFEIVHNGVSIKRLRTRKTESLAAYLAINQGKIFGREHLIGLFWPDDEEQSARQKLRLALNSIRSIVGNTLDSDRVNVGLVEVEVDYIETLEAIRSGSLPTEQLPDLLPGHEDPWIQGYQNELEAALLQELRIQLETIDLDESSSQRYLRRILELDPLATKEKRLLKSKRKAEAFELGTSPANSFVGRGVELYELELALLGSDEPVLRVVTGPGGIGKTRLAKEVAKFAEQEEIASYFVSLVEAKTVADLKECIRLSLYPGLSGPLEDLIEVQPPTLLVLDNFEQLEQNAFEWVVSTLLRPESSMRVLITTQHSPPDEFIELKLGPLPLPKEADMDQLRLFPATSLFLDRASLAMGVDQAKTLDRSMILLVCRRLGGLPLAIEMAGSQLAFYSLPELSVQLQEKLGRLGFFGNTVEARHSTMRETVMWAWNLLNETEQSIAKAASFLGSDSRLEAIQALLPNLQLEDGIASLLRRSILKRTELVSSSFYQPLEPVRRVILDQTTPEESESFTEKLVHYFSAVRDRESDNFLTLANKLETSTRNLEVAIDWCVKQGEWIRLQKCIECLFFARQRRGQFKQHAFELLQLEPKIPVVEQELRHRLSIVLGSSHYYLCDFPKAREAYEHSLKIAQAMMDVERICSSRANIALALLEMGEFAEASRRHLETLSELPPTTPARRHASILVNESSAQIGLGNLEEAELLIQQALDLTNSEDLQNYHTLVISALGELRFVQKRYQEALDLLGHTADLSESEPSTFLKALAWQCVCYLELGQLSNAKKKIKEFATGVHEKDVEAKDQVIYLAAASYFWQTGDQDLAQRFLRIGRTLQRTSQGRLPPVKQDRLEQLVNDIPETTSKVAFVPDVKAIFHKLLNL